MNGIRCAISLEETEEVDDGINLERWLTKWGARYLLFPRLIRIFGSHSEAKRELKHWIDEYPDARIIDEGDL